MVHSFVPCGSPSCVESHIVLQNQGVGCILLLGGGPRHHVTQRTPHDALLPFKLVMTEQVIQRRRKGQGFPVHGRQTSGGGEFGFCRKEILPSVPSAVQINHLDAVDAFQEVWVGGDGGSRSSSRSQTQQPFAHPLEVGECLFGLLFIQQWRGRNLLTHGGIGF